MFKFVTLASVFLIVCFITMSPGAPAPQGSKSGFGNEVISQSDLDDLDIWDDTAITGTANIPAFKPVDVDTNNNCPSCLPDALLSEHHRW